MPVSIWLSNKICKRTPITISLFPYTYRIWRIWCMYNSNSHLGSKSSLSIFWTSLHTLWLWMDKVVSSSMSWPTNSLQFILPWSPHSVIYSLTIISRKITTFRQPKIKKFNTIIKDNRKVSLVLPLIFCDLW